MANRNSKKEPGVLGKTFKIIAFIMTFVIMVSVVAWGVVMQSNYHFDDYPYFTHNTIWNYIGIIFNIFLIWGLTEIFKRRKINQYIALAVYGIICLAFVLIVQLYPFSDMLNIFQIAANGLGDINGYLSSCNNQIPITIMLYLLRFIGKGIIVPKIFNIVCNLVIAVMICNIVRVLFGRDKMTMVYIILFLPAIIYANHIYNDTVSTALTVTMAYFALNRSRSKLKFVSLAVLSAVSIWLRASNIIFVIAIVLYMIFSNRMWKKAVLYIGLSGLFLGGLSIVSDRAVPVNADNSYPVWSYIQMGFNEEEFGFQDGSHSVSYTAKDCVDKVKALGVLRTTKLLVKKELWMWSEGTFQAERYGFGDQNAVYEKENFVTKDLRKMDNSIVRRFCNYFMKGQFWVLMFLAAVGVFTNRNRYNVELLLYFFCGYFCFYLVWEMKSRYIFSLYPYILIFAGQGVQSIREVLSKHNN